MAARPAKGERLKRPLPRPSPRPRELCSLDDCQYLFVKSHRCTPCRVRTSSSSPSPPHARQPASGACVP
ncbi:unnamed protein product [Periconia digitata]|uniref:Uncharacterized protein n=1 Tax=Periconia digitata TaxID=1303443 RepID=A0A9W4UDM4_9PLEO|nr:unnamed protein product [Periconia digitata]